MPDPFRRLSQRVVLNSVWLILARITSQVLSIIFTILVARNLGEVGLGQYAFIVAIIFIGNVLTTFGLDTLLIRAIAGTGDLSTLYLGAALWVQLSLSGIFIAGVFILSNHFPGRTSETLISLELLSFSLIPLAFYTLFSAVQRARERMDLFLFSNLVVALGQTGGAWIVFRSGGGLMALAVVLLTAQILGALSSASLCILHLPGLRIQWNVPHQLFPVIVRQAWPLALLAVLAVLYQRMGVLALSLLSTEATTGWFSAAARVIEAFKIVHYALLGAIFPILSRLPSTINQAKYSEISFVPLVARLYKASFILLITLSTGSALSLTFLAGPLIRLLYGIGYVPSVAPLQILAWSLIPYAYSAKTSLKLVTGGRESLVLKASLVSLVTASFLYGLLIPTHGLLGASLAALLSESVQALVYLLLVATHHTEDITQAYMIKKSREPAIKPAR